MGAEAERRPVLGANVGFAVTPQGAGLAYAVVRRGEGEPARLRVPFRWRPLPALRGRDVAYAALTAVAEELLRRGARPVRFFVDDESLADDLAERRSVPNALTMPYVRLRCVLNRLPGAAVSRGGDEAREASARARAELSLDLAA